MREQKRARDEEKKKRQEKITGGISNLQDSKVTNEFVDKILRDEDPFDIKDPNKKELGESVIHEALKESTFVIDMQIMPPEKVVTYERNIQCQIIDATQVKKLETIREEEEHEQEAKVFTMEMAAMGMTPPG